MTDNEQLTMNNEQGEGEEKKKEKFFDKKKCKNCEKAEQERDECKAGWHRALADYQNLQKETGRRMGEWTRMSEAQILSEFIPVFDNLKKAFAVKHANEDANNANGNTNASEANWKKGIEYIMKQFGEVLKAHGVEEIKTVGEMFDASRHEAVGEDVPAEAQKAKEGEILREIESGYTMGGKVLKVAKVIVAKGK